MGSARGAEIRCIDAIISARIARVFNDLEKVYEEICVRADNSNAGARRLISQSEQIWIVGKRIQNGLTYLMPADVIQQLLPATAFRKAPGKKEVECIAMHLQSGQAGAIEIPGLGKIFEDVGGRGSVY